MSLTREEVLQTVEAARKYYENPGHYMPPIEIEFHHNGEWKSIYDPTFDSDEMLYRVKPRKKKPFIKIGDRVRRRGCNDEYLITGTTSTHVLVANKITYFKEFYERYEII